MTSAKPQLVKARLNKLLPTQITVGMAEVALKRQRWASLGRKARITALSDHWFPSIIGPEGRHYIVDHHHFGLALHQEGVKSVRLMILKDLSWLEPLHFWHVMDHHQWVHPYDSEGLRRDFSAVPHHLSALQDDPYRSLAGELRSAGGYAKDVTPFSEFLWADFFRSRIAPAILQKNFSKALEQAMKLARSQQARYLPGWTGVVPPG